MGSHWTVEVTIERESNLLFKYFVEIRISDPNLKEAVMSILYAEPRTNNIKELKMVIQKRLLKRNLFL